MRNIPLNELTIHFCESNEMCFNTNICKKIQRIKSIRYLGVTFDEHLRWDLYINYLIKPLRVSVYHLYKLH